MYKPQILADWLLKSFQGYNTELPMTEASLMEALATITDGTDLEELGISFFESVDDFIQTQGFGYFSYVKDFDKLSHEDQVQIATADIAFDPTMFFMEDGHLVNFNEL